MKNSEHFKILFMIIFLGLLSMYSTTCMLLGMPINYDRSYKDDVTLYSDQLNKLTKFLPSNQPIGFLVIGTPDSENRDFYLTQYALSPILIINSPQPAIDIGIIKDKKELKSNLTNEQLQIAKNLGYNIMLLHHTK